jgi:hypothetical protein
MVVAALILSEGLLVSNAKPELITCDIWAETIMSKENMMKIEKLKSIG